jgi:iron complex outermembrane receptor protein
LISQAEDTSGQFFYDNLSSATTKGLDFELEGKTESGWLGRLGYTWQHTADQASGETLTNSPAHLVKFNMIAPLYQDKLFAGLEMQYSSSVKTLSGSTKDGYWLTNLNLYSQRLVPGVEGLDLSLGIFNLFDEEYALPGAEEHVQDVIQQDGRTFQATLRYRF